MSVMPENVFGYPDAVWRHFAMPVHAGVLPAAARVAEAGSPAARSLLRMAVTVDKGQIGEARFLAYGCPVTIAVGNWLAGWLTGRRVTDLRLDAADIRTALEIPEEKTHCALMGEDIIRRLREWSVS